MGRLDGRIALITGGTTGIGFATAKLFRDEGARVIVTGRNADRVVQAREELGRGVEAVTADVARKEDTNSLFVRLARDHGRLDVLFLNAISPGPVETPIIGKLGLPAETLKGFGERVRTRTLVKRFGGPEEIAKAALFLASSDSSFLVGAEIVADGGLTVAA